MNPAPIHNDLVRATVCHHEQNWFPNEEHVGAHIMTARRRPCTDARNHMHRVSVSVSPFFPPDANSPGHLAEEVAENRRGGRGAGRGRWGGRVGRGGRAHQGRGNEHGGHGRCEDPAAGIQLPCHRSSLPR